MKISIIQQNVHERDIEYNFSQCEALIKKACEEKPDVILLPEMWNTGFFPDKSEEELFDENGERTKSLLSRFSRENGVYIVGGSIAEKKNGKNYNTCYVYNPKGENISSYSKAHLFSYMGENNVFAEGDGIKLFDIGSVRAGVVICYDIRFPEYIRKAALEGAELIFAVCQWPEERLPQLDILCKARAVENQLHVVMCNACGYFDGACFGGNSSVYDCFGNVLKKASSEEEILTAEIFFSEQKSLRSSMKVFSDRRPEIY